MYVYLSSYVCFKVCLLDESFCLTDGSSAAVVGGVLMGFFLLVLLVAAAAVYFFFFYQKRAHSCTENKMRCVLKSWKVTRNNVLLLKTLFISFSSSVGRTLILQGSASQLVLCCQLILMGISLHISESLTSAHWCKRGHFIHVHDCFCKLILSRWSLNSWPLLSLGADLGEKNNNNKIPTIADYFLRPAWLTVLFVICDVGVFEHTQKECHFYVY